MALGRSPTVESKMKMTQFNLHPLILIFKHQEGASKCAPFLIKLLSYSIINKIIQKKQELSQINSLTYHLKEFEKEEQKKCKLSRRKEIINIREEINKIEIKNRKKISKSQELVL